MAPVSGLEPGHYVGQIKRSMIWSGATNPLELVRLIDEAVEHDPQVETQIERLVTVFDVLGVDRLSQNPSPEGLDVSALAAFVDGHHDVEVGPFIGFNQSSLNDALTTYDAKGSQVGLHLDSWHGGSARERLASPHRLMVNLGPGSRALVYIPVEPLQFLAADTLLSQTFADQNAWRAIINRYESVPFAVAIVPAGYGYLAPTERILHDGSGAWSQQSSLAVMWHMRPTAARCKATPGLPRAISRSPNDREIMERYRVWATFYPDGRQGQRGGRSARRELHDWGLSKGDHGWLSATDKVVTGATWCTESRPADDLQGLVVTVAVHPNYRRSGIARQLLKALEASARLEATATSSQLIAHIVLANEPSRRLFSQANFTLVKSGGPYETWSKQLA